MLKLIITINLRYIALFFLVWYNNNKTLRNRETKYRGGTFVLSSFELSEVRTEEEMEER